MTYGRYMEFNLVSKSFLAILSFRHVCDCVRTFFLKIATKENIYFRYKIYFGKSISRLPLLLSGPKWNELSCHNVAVHTPAFVRRDRFFYNLRTSPVQYRYYSNNVLDKIYVQSLVFAILTSENRLAFHVSYFIVRGDKENVFFSSLRSLDIFLIVNEKYN